MPTATKENDLIKLEIVDNYAQFYMSSSGVRYMEGRFDFSPDYPH